MTPSRSAIDFMPYARWNCLLLVLGWWIIPALAAVEPAPAPVATATLPCVGTWITEERDGIIEISPAETGVTGRIIAITAADATLLDVKNPDPALRSRPILGHVFMHFTHWDAARKRWDAGSVYDSESGETYSKVTLAVTNDVLVLTVSALGGLWSEKMKFTAIDPNSSRQAEADEPKLVYLAPYGAAATSP